MARLVSLGIIAVLIVCLGITFYQVMAPFLMPLFLAAMTALFSQPLLHRLETRFKGRRKLAALATTGCVLTIVMLPLLMGVLMGVHQFLKLATFGMDKWDVVRAEVQGSASDPPITDTLRVLGDSVFKTVNEEVLGEDPTPLDYEFLHLSKEQASDPETLRTARLAWFHKQLEASRGQMMSAMLELARKTVGVIGSTLGLVLGGATGQALGLLGMLAAASVALAVFSMALFYFLAEGPELVAAAQSLIPVERVHQTELMKQFENSVRAVVLSTFLAAFAQGLATALVMKLLGFNHFFILLIVATFSAMIPMAGTWLVWLPGAILLWVEHSYASAVFLALFGTIVIGMMDNLIRTWVLQSDTKLHPLLAFVSVLGGLQVMGLWGVFIGPIVACCLHSLIEIFNQELQADSKPGALAGPSDESLEAAEAHPVLDKPASEQSTLAESAQVGIDLPAQKADDTGDPKETESEREKE